MSFESVLDIIKEYGHHNRWKGVGWVNKVQAIGYALMAAKDLGMSKSELQHLESLMRQRMDEHTEKEAEKIYMEN